MAFIWTQVIGERFKCMFNISYIICVTYDFIVFRLRYGFVEYIVNAQTPAITLEFRKIILFMFVLRHFAAIVIDP